MLGGKRAQSEQQRESQFRGSNRIEDTLFPRLDGLHKVDTPQRCTGWRMTTKRLLSLGTIFSRPLILPAITSTTSLSPFRMSTASATEQDGTLFKTEDGQCCMLAPIHGRPDHHHETVEWRQELTPEEFHCLREKVRFRSPLAWVRIAYSLIACCRAPNVPELARLAGARGLGLSIRSDLPCRRCGTLLTLPVTPTSAV